MSQASFRMMAVALLILLAGCAPARHYEAVLVLQDFAAAQGHLAAQADHRRAAAADPDLHGGGA